MTKLGFIGSCVLGVVLCGSPASAQDFTRYREFELGSAVAAVSMLTGVAESELKQIHQRPALIQQLTWRPGYAARRSPGGDAQSAEQIIFDFYDGRLFRVTVYYDRAQTEGLTDADMIEAISGVYGPPPTRAVALSKRRSVATSNDDLGAPIAEWGDESSSLALHRRSTYALAFTLVVTDEPAAALARAAVARAVLLDAREAPQREAARQKKEADDRRAAEEKARSINKPIFRP